MKKWVICLVDLKSSIGREQAGERPAIIVATTKMSLVMVIPLTSNLKALRFPYTIAITPDKINKLSRESVALVFHMRAIDNLRIKDVLGTLSPADQRKIKTILKEMLEL